MPQAFLPLACTANLAKNLAAVAASSTRAPIYRTFALQNNLAGRPNPPVSQAVQLRMCLACHLAVKAAFLQQICTNAASLLDIAYQTMFAGMQKLFKKGLFTTKTFLLDCQCNWECNSCNLTAFIFVSNNSSVGDPCTYYIKM